ncbi:hypothetical protein Tco_0785345 [Tanacetum coccineum]
MKKVHRLLSMTDGDERKHVLDYTHVDIHYVEDQRKNLVNKFNLLKQELSLHKSELCNLKNIVSINCSLQNEVIRVNLENESLKDEISDLKKADESSSMPILEMTSDSESECETQEPLPPLPKLIRAAPAGTPNMSPTYAIKKKTETKSPIVHVPQPEKKADLSAEQLLLTLIDEVKSLKEQIKVPSDNSPSVSQTRSSKSSKGKQTTWFRPSKHCGFKNHHAKDCYIKPKCSTDHLTKEHLEQTAVNKTLAKLKAQSSVNPSAKKAPMIPKPFKECKYYGFNNRHSDNYEYYPGCEVCGSVAHETTDCPKKHPNNRKSRIANKRSTAPTEKSAEYKTQRYQRLTECKASSGIEGLAECKASASNLRRIQVKYIVKEVEDYLKTYSSAGMDISCDSDVEKDLRSSSEFIIDLNAEYPERALLANQKRFYKRSECLLNQTSTPSYPPSNKSSTPSYPSSNKSYNKPKTPTHTSPQNDDNHQKDYKGKYKGLKSEIAVLTKKIDAMSKGKSEKRLMQDLALGGRGKRKYKISSNEVIFTKADESSSMPILENTSVFESE